MLVVYLHGFASSPRSSKARFFGERLAACGIDFHCPDLNAPDFATLTTTRMIAQTEAIVDGLPPEPIVLVGSSLGALVAWHVAARAESRVSGPGAPRIERLVLLAPAFDFGTSWRRDLGEDGIARWRETGFRTFQHYAYDEPRDVHYGLFDDARRYRADLARVNAPTLVFHGRQDATVDPEMVIAFAATRPSILLRLLEDDHQLLRHLETMWTETAAFLGLPQR